MEISPIELNQGGFGTRFHGAIADQAALRGILNSLWDLNLTIISVKRLGPSDWEQVC